MEGTVKWYNIKKGYGFISGEDGEDYFVHFTSIDKGTFIRENDKVSFDPATTDKGKQAQNVKLLQKGSEITKGRGSKEEQEEYQEDDFDEEE